MGGFRPLGARLRTLALPFDKCTAPVKLPAWQGLQIGSPATARAASLQFYKVGPLGPVSAPLNK